MIRNSERWLGRAVIGAAILGAGFFGKDADSATAAGCDICLESEPVPVLMMPGYKMTFIDDFRKVYIESKTSVFGLWPTWRGANIGRRKVDDLCGIEKIEVMSVINPRLFEYSVTVEDPQCSQKMFGHVKPF